jgi:hypothetical protein
MGEILGFEKMVSNNIMGPHFRIMVCTNMLLAFGLGHDFVGLEFQREPFMVKVWLTSYGV